MSVEKNKALVQQLFDEAWNQGNLDIVDELVAPGYLLHAYSEDEAFGSGADGLKQLIASSRAWFPEGHITIEDQIAESDKVVTRWKSQNTSTATSKGIWIHRLDGDKIVEAWVDWDRLGLFRQLGMIADKG